MYIHNHEQIYLYMCLSFSHIAATVCNFIGQIDQVYWSIKAKPPE